MAKKKFDPYANVTWTATPQQGDEILQSLPGRRGYGYKGGPTGSPGASPIAVRRGTGFAGPMQMPPEYTTPAPGGVNMAIPDQYTQTPPVPREPVTSPQTPMTAPQAPTTLPTQKSTEGRRTTSQMREIDKRQKSNLDDIMWSGGVYDTQRPPDPRSFQKIEKARKTDQVLRADRRPRGDYRPAVGPFQTEPMRPSQRKLDEMREYNKDPRNFFRDIGRVVTDVIVWGGGLAIGSPILGRLPIVGPALRQMAGGGSGKAPTRTRTRLSDPSTLHPEAKPVQWRKTGPDVGAELPPGTPQSRGTVSSPKTGRLVDKPTARRETMEGYGEASRRTPKPSEPLPGAVQRTTGSTRADVEAGRGFEQIGPESVAAEKAARAAAARAQVPAPSQPAPTSQRRTGSTKAEVQAGRGSEPVGTEVGPAAKAARAAEARKKATPNPTDNPELFAPEPAPRMSDWDWRPGQRANPLPSKPPKTAKKKTTKKKTTKKKTTKKATTKKKTKKGKQDPRSEIDPLNPEDKYDFPR